MRAPVLMALVALAVSGCRAEYNAHVTDSTGKRIVFDSTGGKSGDRAIEVAHIVALEDPESVRYDAELDAFFISNMAGYGSVKDGIGYIVRVNAADLSDVKLFAASGQNGAVLDAPKGLAIVGDTLWAADIDVVRGFDKRTGASVGVIDLRRFGPTLLNDIAPGPNGTLRVSDSGLLMSPSGVIYLNPGAIFEIDSRRNVTLIARDSLLGHPNGLAWDERARRWLMVNFAPFRSELTTRGDSIRVLSVTAGRNDGVELLADGRVVYTNWKDSSVHVWRDGRDERVIRAMPMPADLGVDLKRNRIAVPLVGAGRVEIWSLPSRSRY